MITTNTMNETINKTLDLINQIKVDKFQIESALRRANTKLIAAGLEPERVDGIIW